MTWVVATQAPGSSGQYVFPDQASAERFAAKVRAESGANRAVAYDDPDPLEPYEGGA